MSNSSSGHLTFTLWAQGQQVALSEGVALPSAQFPMLVPASPGGPVALVNVNPHDPTQLGLRNLTTSSWTATLPDGSSKEIGTDKSVRLASGTVIQAGPLQWEIREQAVPAAAPAAAHFAPSPQAAAGFVAASEPAIQPQPVSPSSAGAGFVQASAPAAPPQVGFYPATPPAASPPPVVGFVQASPPPPVGFVQADPPPPIGFVQDNAPAMPGQAPKRPGGAARNVLGSSSIRLSQILPVMGNRKALMSKGFLIPGLVTAITVGLLFDSIGKEDYLQFCHVLGIYIGFGLLFAVYQLCGKSKPWYVMAAPIVFVYLWLTAGGANSPFQLLYHVFSLVGEPDEHNPNILQQLFQFTFAVGVREELTKALPVLLLLFFAPKLSSPLREQASVIEPLDGILLGAAAGLGFTFAETLGQYVPNIIAEVANQTGNLKEGGMMGVMLVTARLLSEIMGHLAYSGCFGYFIGLAALKPKHRWLFLGLGLLTSIVLHGFWDATANTTPLMIFEGAITYAFLVAAILKARQLSPDRAHNFATQIKGV